MVEQFARVPATGETVPLTSVAPVDPPLAPEPLTARIPLFHGVGGLHIAPADLLLVLVCFIALGRTADRSRARTVVWYALLGLMGAVAIGTALGIVHHGDIRVAFMETRPYVYLVATYLLTASLVDGPPGAAGGAVGARGLRRAQGPPGARDLPPGPPHEPAPGGGARVTRSRSSSPSSPSSCSRCGCGASRGGSGRRRRRSCPSSPSPTSPTTAAPRGSCSAAGS